MLIVIICFFLIPLMYGVTSAADVPYLQGRVTDDAEILKPGTINRINSQLQAHENQTTNQVAVLTVNSLQGESIESFAIQVFESWKLGQKGKDNGVLVLIAPQERRMRIEVGYGLEGSLTDLEAGRIIRNIMAPRFKAGDFNGGIEKAVQAIVGQLEGTGEIPAAPSSSVRRAGDSIFKGPELGLVERFLIGAFVFGIIGLFTVLGIMTPRTGWFLYFFLIPFWAMFPIVVVGTQGAFKMLVTYLIGFPIIKIILSRTKMYKRVGRELKSKGRARIGGFTFSSGGRSSGSSWSSSSSGFSGGGGSSGGGGASGSW